MKKLILSLGLITMLAVAQAGEYGQRQVTGHAYTSSGYIKSGLKGLTLITSGSFTGKVGDAVLPSSTVIPVPVYPQDYLGDVYYTVTGGTLYTIEVR